MRCRYPTLHAGCTIEPPGPALLLKAQGGTRLAMHTDCIPVSTCMRCSFVPCQQYCGDCAGALAELQAAMLKEGAEFKDLPLAADLGILALSEFGATMLQGGIIFTGGSLSIARVLLQK